MPCALDDGQEALDVVAQLFGRDGGVFDERERLGVGLHRHRQAERRLAQAPDVRLRRRVEHAVVPVAQPVRAQVALDGIQARRQILVAVAIELDAQQRARVAVDEAAAQRVERGALPGVIEDELVHHLDRRRAMPEDDGRRGERLEQIVELDGEHRLGLRQRHQVELSRSSTTPSVPSDPTISLARLNGRSGRMNSSRL